MFVSAVQEFLRQAPYPSIKPAEATRKYGVSYLGLIIIRYVGGVGTLAP